MSVGSLRRSRAPRSAPAAGETPLAVWRPTHLSLEALLYAALFVAACLSRFWDLGSRALHHDESLHAQFSWLLAVGRGYTHDPLMHGPFLFHANALVYLLFGANDATSRIVPALVGSLLVLVPLLLRQQIGRWAALFASALLLISPAFLYYSRFIRHDIYTATGTLLLFIALVRYIEDRRPRWVYLGAGALAWSLTNHEITYAIMFIFATFLGGILIWRLSVRLAFVAVATAATMGLTALVLPNVLHWPPLPAIPWQAPSQTNITAFVAGMLTHPLVLALIIEAAAGLAAAIILLAVLVRPPVGKRVSQGHTWLDRLLGRYEPGSTPHAIYALLRDPAALAGAGLLFVGIWATLYTTFFANLPGLLSGAFGALGYWLGQHDVQRGEQPWFYYLILMPQYELIAVVFGGVMTAVTGTRVVRFWAGRRPGSHRLFTHAFLAYWAVALFLILSWAGEKMPWLVTHASLPFTLLAACALGEVVERLVRAGPRLDAGGLPWGIARRTPLSLGYAAALVLIAALFVYGAAAASSATPAQPLPVLPTLLAGALATIGLALLVGMRRSLLVASLSIALLLGLAEVRFAWIASFVHADVPKEQLIYVQTSQDVPRVVGEIERLSRELTGDLSLGLIYDGGNNGVAWPFEWYLRDFTNKRFLVDGPTSVPPPDVKVVIIGAGNRDRAEPYLTDYVPIEYVLRWWYPEEQTYRPFAIAPELRPGRSAWQREDQPHGFIDIAGSVIRSIAAQRDPAEQARLWRYFMDREPYAPLGSFDFVLYIHKDILRYYNGLRY